MKIKNIVNGIIITAIVVVTANTCVAPSGKVINFSRITGSDNKIISIYKDFCKTIKDEVKSKSDQITLKIKDNSNETYQAFYNGDKIEGTKNKSDYISSKITVKNSSELYSAIKKCLTDVHDTIKLTILNKNISNENYVIEVAKEVVKDNPNLKYYNYLSVQRIGNNYTVKFDFNFSRDKIIEMNKKVDAKAKSIINKIVKDRMTIYEKEKAIHDYIVNNTEYDMENYKKNALPKEVFTSYGVLINGVGVCEGYANAMLKLMEEAGIECKVITGYAGGVSHAWNLVKIDKKYYHVDATWDDPVTNTGRNILRYDYYNKSDSEMSKTHSWGK